MTEARDDGIAAPNVVLEVFIAERQQVGLDQHQVGVIRRARRELVAGSHNEADAEAAAQKLLQDALARASGPANEKNGLP
jgi:hypothetical protein